MTENEVVVKIRKLLELASAERNPSAQEAETAMAKVQELLAKYELDLATVQQTDNQSKEDFETIPYGESFNRESPQHRFVSPIIQDYFHVKILRGPGEVAERLGRHRFRFRKLFDGPGKRYIFLGRKTNVQVAQYVYGFLHAEFERLWKLYQHETGKGVASRFDFYKGLYCGLSEKLRKEEQGRTQTMPAPQQQSTAIIKRDEAEALAEYLHQQFPRLGHSSRSYRDHVDGEAQSDGHSAGRNLNIRPAVSDEIGRRSLPQVKVTTE